MPFVHLNILRVGFVRDVISPDGNGKTTLAHTTVQSHYRGNFKLPLKKAELVIYLKGRATLTFA